MAPRINYYKDVPNRAEIEALFEPYDMEECMSDIEFFAEFKQDLIDDHPHIKNLQLVLDRMMRVAFNRAGFGL